jgi:RNA polymerase sigma factor (sigma-70 family)
MTVRVVTPDPVKCQSFWKSIDANKTLIEKCFRFLLRKFPNVEGDQDAYDTLLQRLYELSVFDRFDPRCLVAKSRGIHKTQVHTVDAEDCTKENLAKIGINVDKKYEQFIYKWIEHILQECYTKSKKQATRYIRLPEHVNHPPRTSKELREILSENQWAQSEDERKELEVHLCKKETIEHLKVYPTYQDTGNYVGHPSEDALETVTATDLTDKIRAEMRNPRERQVLDLTLEGLKGSEIAEAVGCSPQNVNILLNRIREKYTRYAQAELEIA